MDDLIGLSFAGLTVTHRCGSNKRKEKLWLCQCICGNTKIVKSANLKKGKVRSCGCLRTGPRRFNLAGQKFTRLLVLEFVKRDKWQSSYYKCICDCGQIVIVGARALKTTKTKSCGCLKNEVDNNRKSSNNPSWNPERSEEERLNGRNIDGYTEWSFNVKRRDNFTCRKCQMKSSGLLVSHHLFNYHDFPKLRTDITNGVCLCHDCHMKFHNKYGRRHNTPEQFNEFERSKNE